MTPLQIAREALARQAEADGAPHTAACYRDGRYDEGGIMPAALAAATLALKHAESDITTAFELGYKACEKGDNIQKALIDFKALQS